MRTLLLCLLVACSGGSGDDPGSEDSGVHTSEPGDDDDDVTPTETVATLPGGLDSRDGGCLRTDGTSDRVRSIDAELPLGDAPRTVQAWVLTDNAVGDQVAVSHGNGSPGRAFFLGTSDGYLMVSAGGLPSVAEDAFVADGRWHHVAATYGEGVAWLWVDGERITSAELAVDTPDGEVVAGNAPIGQTLPWKGWLDEVKVYARVRPDADIEADVDGDELGLKVWWGFETRGVGAGIDVPDLSGMGGDAETGGTEDTPQMRSCP